MDQDEVLSTPVEVARKLPADILKLAGYRTWVNLINIYSVKLMDYFTDKAVGGVGYVEDHQSPVEFLQSEQNGIGKYGGIAKVAV